MKKTLLILLAIVYLASSAGATLQFHYCMDKLVGIGLHGSDSAMCAKCGMKKQEGCCKDEAKQIKLSDDQKPAFTFVLNVVGGEYIARVYPIEYSTFFASHPLLLQSTTNSPPTTAIGLYKFLGVLRI